jgi:uncharacterized lipoprotein YbaY
MQTTSRKQLLLVALGTVALLAACGGGGGSSEPAPPAVVAGTDLPVAVEQSVKGVIDYAKAQIAATSETSDPQIIGNAKLFTDDTAEPSDI